MDRETLATRIAKRIAESVPSTSTYESAIADVVAAELADDAERHPHAKHAKRALDRD